MIKIIAHRGFSGNYPENTLLSFQKALETGCDGMEFDLHLSADGELVILHDERLERTTDGTGFVKDFTLAQLQQRNAGAKFEGGVHGFQPIPTLRQYFELVKDLPNFITNIELKTGIFEYPTIEEKTLAMIDEFSLRPNIIISSFNHYTIRRFRALAADVKLAYLYDGMIVEAGEYAKRNGVECLHPFFPTLTPENYGEMVRAGREVNTWTVNEPEYLRMVCELGVNGIITNYPDRAQQCIAQYHR
ncbi:MAG: glycerophosphodiester phosphodiesterase [Angelakisella sp.]